MITFIRPPEEVDVPTVRLWDEFLALTVDENTKEHIRRLGVENTIAAIRKGRFVVTKTNLEFRSEGYMPFKHRMSNRPPGTWTVGCDKCMCGVLLVLDRFGKSSGRYRCGCRDWSVKEIKETRDELERGSSGDEESAGQNEPSALHDPGAGSTQQQETH